MHTIIIHIARGLGLTDPSGPWYLFWSGIGSDIGELTIVAAVLHHLTNTKKHNESLKRHLDRKFANLTDDETT